MSMTKLIRLAVASMVLLSMVVGWSYLGVKKSRQKNEVSEDDGSSGKEWERRFKKLDGYYNGVRTLVPFSDYKAQNQYAQGLPLALEQSEGLSKRPPLDPVAYKPYPEYESHEYRKDHHEVAQCFLDENEEIAPPDVYVYPGLPQHFPQQFYGSYSELGLREDICFDRFGRLGPYGLGGGDGRVGTNTENRGGEKVFEKYSPIDYTKIDWGTAQRRCIEKNKARFDEQQRGGKERVKRHAYVLRTWTGYKFSEHQILSLRAMINELALKSGGEYDVHFLVHVKDKGLPIWADEGLYQETLQDAVPREFWNVSTLWSEQQMMMYYPAPFGDSFANMAASTLHGVYRSPHFALQWFGQQHPEYDFFWNWEMDVRYSGHYYELNSKIGDWAKKQPRKGLWDRGRRFWFPQHHGDYQNFTKFVERETIEVDVWKNDLEKNGPIPIWGPVQKFKNSGMLAPPPETKPPTTYKRDDYEWGVGEDADLLTFNPLFDPSMSNWVFRADMTGYDKSRPIPPRRASIITAARLSKRLLNIMHEEVWRQKHTAFPEMWAPTVCLHHGLKAVYIPHPVYFSRDWELGYMNDVFNYPKAIHASPYGWGEHILLGSTFYYNSGFSATLWRRWLGQKEDGHGGRTEEEKGTGRMCLRPILHHPVKREDFPVH